MYYSRLSIDIKSLFCIRELFSSWLFNFWVLRGCLGQALCPTTSNHSSRETCQPLYGLQFPRAPWGVLCHPEGWESGSGSWRREGNVEILATAARGGMGDIAAELEPVGLVLTTQPIGCQLYSAHLAYLIILMFISLFLIYVISLAKCLHFTT